MKLGMTLPVLLAFVFGLSAVYAQQDANNVSSCIKNQQYIFKAQTALPLRGGFMQLTQGYYDVTITKDSVVSFLPYFGRAYTPPINPADAGIKFVSTKFDYKASVNKKGNWEITITPKDVSDIQQLNIQVTESGQAFLQVTSLNRQAISFNGNIEKRKR
jgi:hypothetical protein